MATSGQPAGEQAEDLLDRQALDRPAVATDDRVGDEEGVDDGLLGRFDDTVVGRDGRTIEGLPVERVVELLAGRPA